MIPTQYRNTYVFLVNVDVEMSGGKAGAQVSNVACKLPKMTKTKEEPCTHVLGARHSYMNLLLYKYKKRLGIKATIDAGLTEGTVDVLTCIGWKLKCEEDRVFSNGLPLWTDQLHKLVCNFHEEKFK